MIFCVEDDSAIRDLMIYALNSSGLEARGLGDGNELFEALKSDIPQLIMLDIMLPGDDGIKLLKRIRSSALYGNIPVILATAKSTEYDKVIGLDLGADDYLSKPFGMMEMVARVKAVLRRTEKGKEQKCLKVGDIEMDLARHTVSVKGERVQLTLKEYELLHKFIKNPGMVFTREQLLQSIWGSDFVGETRTVDVHIGTLRTKLGDSGDYIETVRGVGYRMEVPV